MKINKESGGSVDVVPESVKKAGKTAAAGLWRYLKWFAYMSVLVTIMVILMMMFPTKQEEEKRQQVREMLDR